MLFFFVMLLFFIFAGAKLGANMDRVEEEGELGHHHLLESRSEHFDFISENLVLRFKNDSINVLFCLFVELFWVFPFNDSRHNHRGNLDH